MLSRATPLHRAVEELRCKAAELRDSFGGEAVARALEWAAGRVEVALQATGHALLSLEEASDLSGYSTEHLARLVRSGRIPDMRPPGSKGRIYVQASDLPMRPRQSHTPHADVHELASRLFGGKGA